IHLRFITLESGRGGATSAGFDEGLDGAAERGHVDAARVDLPALGVADLLVTLDSGRREPERPAQLGTQGPVGAELDIRPGFAHFVVTGLYTDRVGLAVEAVVRDGSGVVGHSGCYNVDCPVTVQ